VIGLLCIKLHFALIGPIWLNLVKHMFATIITQRIRRESNANQVF
jgi:hypothetical protein